MTGVSYEEDAPFHMEVAGALAGPTSRRAGFGSFTVSPYRFLDTGDALMELLLVVEADGSQAFVDRVSTAATGFSEPHLAAMLMRLLTGTLGVRPAWMSPEGAPSGDQLAFLEASLVGWGLIRFWGPAHGLGEIVGLAGYHCKSRDDVMIELLEYLGRFPPAAALTQEALTTLRIEMVREALKTEWRMLCLAMDALFMEYCAGALALGKDVGRHEWEYLQWWLIQRYLDADEIVQAGWNRQALLQKSVGRWLFHHPEGAALLSSVAGSSPTPRARV